MEPVTFGGISTIFLTGGRVGRWGVGGRDGAGVR